MNPNIPTVNFILPATRGDVEFFKGLAVDVPLDSSTAENGKSLLSVAAQENHLDCCQEIYRRSPLMLYDVDNDQNTALHLAAEKGNVEVVKFLINANLQTPFHHQEQQDIEVGRGSEARERQRLLLSMVNGKGETCLHAAVKSGKFETVSLVIEQDRSYELFLVADLKRNTALHLAVEENNVEIVRFLIEQGPAFGYLPNDSGLTPLLIAMHRALTNDAWISTRRLILELQPSSCTVLTGVDDWTPLHFAAQIRDLGSIEDIVRFCPFSMELVDRNGRNFLHVAAMFGSVSVVSYALECTEISNSVLNKQDCYGQTPLHVAVVTGNSTLATWFLYDSRVNKKTIDYSGKPVLAAIKFDFDIVRAGVVGNLIIGDERDLKEQRNFDLLVCALIATISFTAAITVPGGYTSEGTNKGIALLTKERSFRVFIIANTFAFMFSLYTLFNHFFARSILTQEEIFYENKSATFRTIFLLKREDMTHQINMSTFCTLCSVYAMVLAFLTGSFAVLGNSDGLARAVTAITCCFLIFTLPRMGKMVLMFLVSVLLRCCGSNPL